MLVTIVGSRGMLGTDLMAVFGSTCDVMGLDLPEFDITSPEQCRNVVNDLKPDVIINAAAFTRVDDCETRQNEALQVNGHGPGNLARAAAESGSLLVHYSTDYVFDGMKGEAYLEDDEPNPQSVYGKSKLLGETLIRKYCPEKHIILRTSWLFGMNGPNFIRTITGLAEKGGPLRVVNDQQGSPTFTADLAARTQKMIEAGCRSTYHVTNSGSCTWYELAGQVVQWAGFREVQVVPVTTAEFPRPARRPANSILANRRLESEGFAPMRSWQSAAREYVEKQFGVAEQKLPDRKE